MSFLGERWRARHDLFVRRFQECPRTRLVPGSHPDFDHSVIY
ncbi:hypothetical protein FRUB_09878 [Fimbriiglobus ruber]|uniref:Uncharacterized protein n=1 Tax=Fimbriiglobus ruber TaxID=1908690 RepID=A0A225DCJ4_9BACT|nr:hypothetical protein FRUB_09878 [Fimbriiglobus ruber]